MPAHALALSTDGLDTPLGASEPSPNYRSLLPGLRRDRSCSQATWPRMGVCDSGCSAKRPRDADAPGLSAGELVGVLTRKFAGEADRLEQHPWIGGA